MHLFKQHGVEDHQAAAGQIPVIDYGPYFAGAPGALERVGDEVAHACENIGFFYALNHGVPDELIDRAFAASRRFHRFVTGWQQPCLGPVAAWVSLQPARKRTAPAARYLRFLEDPHRLDAGVENYGWDRSEVERRSVGLTG